MNKRNMNSSTKQNGKSRHTGVKRHSKGAKVMTSVLLAAALTALSLRCSRGADYTYTKVAALGEAAPGGANYFFDFERGQINDRQEIIYTADLSLDGINDIGE